MSHKSRTLHYLGGISGYGVVMQNGLTVAQATFDFDGFFGADAGVTAGGELQMPAEVLKRLFGCTDLQLLTEQGRRLDIHFSETTLPPASDVAHVDVAGELPATWRDCLLTLEADRKNWSKRVASLAAA